jgi:Ca-activated chloride channel homolog
MTFASPWWLLWLLVLPVVVAVYGWSRRRRRRQDAALAAQGLVSTQGGRALNWQRHVPFALFVVALGLVVVACARPMATVSLPRRQATVVLCIDVSNSMAATDVKPSRIGAAKIAAKDFVREQPSSVRIGVVAFGEGAVIVQPPTLDHTDVVQAIDNLSLGGGTSLGAGILTSLDAIAGKTIRVSPAELDNDASGNVNIGYYGGSTIILLSDGEDTSQTNPQTWARLASVAGVRIQTIGVGTPGGTTVRIDGFTVATALDSATLKGVASVTNGTYHQADDQAALKTISKGIDLHFTVVKQYTEITAAFAAAAAVFLVAGALMSMLWFGRVL